MRSFEVLKFLSSLVVYFVLVGLISLAALSPDSEDITMDIVSNQPIFDESATAGTALNNDDNPERSETLNMFDSPVSTIQPDITAVTINSISRLTGGHFQFDN